ncbi:hypothetical protein GMOD_00008982 [Pyrenophora seminiperda CCB06]|uniref:Uncharacterized protein n=1 Tax=Pyrenophora seminiperda CCB06 TaxID=1302712 RepID=A0A3M7MF65_9PLEO|nr:hypothetical protein GMOD_00008982 [Pyrenophora seminiperda CCB06]
MLTSRFFGDHSPNEISSPTTCFDAGIEGAKVKKSPSWFFKGKKAKCDKPLPAPPRPESSETIRPRRQPSDAHSDAFEFDNLPDYHSDDEIEPLLIGRAAAHEAPTTSVKEPKIGLSETTKLQPRYNIFPAPSSRYFGYATPPVPATPVKGYTTVDKPEEPKLKTRPSLSALKAKTVKEDSTIEKSESPQKFRSRRPSFSALRSKGISTPTSLLSSFLHRRPHSNPILPGSSIFGGSKKVADHEPPPPLPPQIPVDIDSYPVPKPYKSVLTPFPTPRVVAARSCLRNTGGQGKGGHQARQISISKPTPMPQECGLPIPMDVPTVPFIKPFGPPPRRPPRPASLDEETLAFMREVGARMVYSPARSQGSGSNSTAAASTSTGTGTAATISSRTDANTPRKRSDTSSIEAYLGFPSGHGTPRKFSIESPLAANHVPSPARRLPCHHRNGSVSYSGFSQGVLYPPSSPFSSPVASSSSSLRGPFEQVRRPTDKEGDWTLEKRVSKEDGVRSGMLFRDQYGGFHFVADI